MSTLAYQPRQDVIVIQDVNVHFLLLLVVVIIIMIIAIAGGRSNQFSGMRLGDQ